MTDQAGPITAEIICNRDDGSSLIDLTNGEWLNQVSIDSKIAEPLAAHLVAFRPDRPAYDAEMVEALLHAITMYSAHDGLCESGDPCDCGLSHIRKAAARLRGQK